MCALIKAAPPKAGKSKATQKYKQNMNKAFGLNEQKN
jgi:hypothetical protein